MLIDVYCNETFNNTEYVPNRIINDNLSQNRSNSSNSATADSTNRNHDNVTNH